MDLLDKIEKQNLKWLKATILGSFWAMNEILLGNFLHNLKFPFTGEILTAIAVCFIFATLQIWDEKGVIIRAGVITAFMKLLSPSIAIIGPIIGILSEAIIIELIIYFFGRGLIGSIVGGGVVVTLPLTQKIINLIILYGLDLILVFSKGVEFISDKLKISYLSSSNVILLIYIINILFGIFAGVSGYFIGKKYLKEKSNSTNIDTTKENIFNNYKNDNFKFSLTFLFINIFMVVVSLLIIGNVNIIISIIFVLFLTIIMIYKYPQASRIFKNYKLWIQLLLFVTLTILILSNINGLNIKQGMISGLNMFLRVIVVSTIFIGISIEIKNPVVNRFIIRIGGNNFAKSVEIAFMITPIFMEIIGREKNIFRNPFYLIKKIIGQLNYWLNEISVSDILNHNIIITGEQGQGKTTALKKIILQLQQRGKKLAGFFSEVIYENNMRIGYDIVDINTLKRKPLCRINKQKTSVMKFNFFREGVLTGNKIISDGLTDKVNFLIIDEIGPYELEGNGWSEMLYNVFRKKNEFSVIVVIRKKLLKDVIKKYKIKNPVIIYANQV